MGKIIEQPTDQSRLVWDQLEEWVRGQVQELIQTILEEEITQLLGRQKSERRQVVVPHQPTATATARGGS